VERRRNILIGVPAAVVLNVRNLSDWEWLLDKPSWEPWLALDAVSVVELDLNTGKLPRATEAELGSEATKLKLWAGFVTGA